MARPTRTRRPTPRPAADRRTRKTIWVVIQEGASSTDRAAYAFDGRAQAEEARRISAENTYATCKPLRVTGIELGTELYIREGDVLALLGRALVIESLREYSVPDGANTSGPPAGRAPRRGASAPGPRRPETAAGRHRRWTCTS